jgi:type III pantothenate kinase
VIQIVADLGNSRLKWGRVGANGALEATVALPTEVTAAWAAGFAAWVPAEEGSSWAVSTVNPPVADRLARFLAERGAGSSVWFRSAADVPLRHTLEHPETAGADRALAVLAATGLNTGPGLIVSCGTAVTVERVGPDGTWQGGAIAPGLGPSATALHRGTAQLPRIDVPNAPPPWGRSTEPALAAGVFWGTVGAIRELLSRQAEGLDPPPWLVWTGGDAQRLAPWIDRPGARVVPDLVLLGLARAAFGPRDLAP